MPRMFDLVGKLEVKGRQYNSPEWWNTAHKLKKQVKKQEYLQNLRTNAKINTQLRISTALDQPHADLYIQQAISSMEISEKYAQLAPWNPIFRKAKTIITFKK